MKLFSSLGIALIVLMLQGCSSSLRYGQWKWFAKPEASYYQRLADNKRGEPIAGLRAGDSIMVFARAGNTLLTTYKGDTVLLDRGQLLVEWEAEPTTFTLPAPQDKDAWARANYYVGKYADLKIQVATDFKVETYNSTKLTPGTSFSVDRLPQGDHVQYTVVSNDDFMAARCAHYIRTGEDVSARWNRWGY